MSRKMPKIGFSTVVVRGREIEIFVHIVKEGSILFKEKGSSPKKHCGVIRYYQQENCWGALNMSNPLRFRPLDSVSWDDGRDQEDEPVTFTRGEFKGFYGDLSKIGRALKDGAPCAKDELASLLNQLAHKGARGQKYIQFVID